MTDRHWSAGLWTPSPPQVSRLTEHGTYNLSQKVEFLSPKRVGGRVAGERVIMCPLSLGDDCGQPSAGAASEREVCREGDL